MQILSFVEFHNLKDKIMGPVIVNESDGEQFVVELWSREWKWTPIAEYDMKAWQDREDASYMDDPLDLRESDDPYYDPMWPLADELEMERPF
jgi:hypothetical protein